MAYLLTAFEYEVEKASDGQEGVDLVREHPPDLILCDLEMPRKSGYEVIADLRARSSRSSMPVIAVTAYAMAGDRDKVLAYGFNGYISKPIYPETFVQQVESFLAADKKPIRGNQPHYTVTPSSPFPHSIKGVILLVDDSPVNVSLIRSTLEPGGYQIIAAGNVPSALGLARGKAIDLILSDLHMIPESGLSFLRAAKEDPYLRKIPLILLTSSMTGPADQTEREAVRLGAARFLSRPISPEELILEVEGCIAAKNDPQ